MPFRRRARRRMPRRRARRGRRRTSARALALRALRYVDQEHGRHDLLVQTTPAPLPALSNGILLNGLAEGDGVLARRGGQSTMISLELHMLFKRGLGSGAANTNEFVHWGVIHDKVNDGILASIDEVWTQVNTGDDLLNVAGVRSLENKKRFRYIAEGRFCLDIARSCKVINVFRKLNFTTRYNAGGADIGDISGGALLFFIWSDKATINEEPLFTLTSRLRYIA